MRSIVKPVLAKVIHSFLFVILIINFINAETNTKGCMVPIPSCGSLKINLPKEWNLKINDENDDRIPTFRITINGDDKLVVLVSPLGPCGSGSNFGSIKEMLESESNMLLPSAIESSVKISSLPSKRNNQISYFSLTDKAPDKDGYKQLTRCIALIDEALINVTIFYNDKKNSKREIFLNALGKAELIEDKNSIKAADKNDTLNFTGEDIFINKDSIAIIGKKESGILTFTDLKTNVAIILPYTESWTFWSTPTTLISGNSQGINFSLMAIKTDQSPLSYMQTVKKQLEDTKERHGLQKAEFKEFKGTKILRTYSIPPKQPGVDMKGIVQFSYFGAKKDSNYLYVYHISKITKTEDDNWTGDKTFLKFASIGLQVNIEKTLR